MVRKIADLPKENFCPDPSHNPPTMIVLEPGIYEHECPTCHKKQQFVIPRKPRLTHTVAAVIQAERDEHKPMAGMHRGHDGFRHYMS